MSRPIKETPILFGEDARRFEERMKQVRRESPEEKERMGKYYNYIVQHKPGLTGVFQISGRERVAFSDHERLEKLLDGYGIYSDDNERREYVIRFYSWAIAIVSNQVWQKDQKLRLLEDGRVLEMRIPVSNHTELLSRILFYGDAAEPVSPQDFVDEYRRKCMLMAGRYERV